MHNSFPQSMCNKEIIVITNSNFFLIERKGNIFFYILCASFYSFKFIAFKNNYIRVQNDYFHPNCKEEITIINYSNYLIATLRVMVNFINFACASSFKSQLQCKIMILEFSLSVFIQTATRKLL